MAQWVKELATKPEDPSSIFSSHMMELTTKRCPHTCPVMHTFLKHKVSEMLF